MPTGQNGSPDTVQQHEGKQQPLDLKKSFIAGLMAGFAVDVIMYPLDTLKTRLQHPKGFLKAGGFNQVYRGLSSVAIGSSPSAGLFFATFDAVNHYLFPQRDAGVDSKAVIVSQHMAAAGIGEVTACLVRVPAENVKVKMQADRTFASSSQCVKWIWQHQGPKGFFVGYGMTLFREIPFAFIQFPLWLEAKARWAERQNAPVTPLQSAACGAASGGIAGFATTPLDVIKTRIMLMSGQHEDSSRASISRVLQEIKLSGKSTSSQLFSGLVPRTAWIGLGGFVFFGFYEVASKFLRDGTDSDEDDSFA